MLNIILLSTSAALDYISFIQQTNASILGAAMNKGNAFELIQIDKQLITFSDIYDSETHKQFTEEDFIKLPEGATKNLYTFVYPGENGKN